MDVADTGQSERPSHGGSPIKQSSREIHSPIKQASREGNLSQNSTSQMNGSIDFDEICNVKNLKDEELFPKIRELVQALKGLEEYDRGETMKIMKSIGDTYWNYKGHRGKIGDILADEGFPGMNILQQLFKKKLKNLSLT